MKASAAILPNSMQIGDGRMPIPTNIKIYDVLRSIDEGFQKFYEENLEQCEQKPDFGDDMCDSLFYFKKRLDGSYQYHLFPELNL